VVAEVLPWLLERANVLHQCGAGAVQRMREAAGRLSAGLAARYLVTGFIGAELPDVLALADVVVSRSGAGTIAELTALGKAAVLIPLPTSAGDEQRHNARHLAACGAAVALDGEVTSGALKAALEPLLADPGRRAALAAGARAPGRRRTAGRRGPGRRGPGRAPWRRHPGGHRLLNRRRLPHPVSCAQAAKARTSCPCIPGVQAHRGRERSPGELRRLARTRSA